VWAWSWSWSWTPGLESAPLPSTSRCAVLTLTTTPLSFLSPRSNRRGTSRGRVLERPAVVLRSPSAVLQEHTRRETDSNSDKNEKLCKLCCYAEHGLELSSAASTLGRPAVCNFASVPTLRLIWTLHYLQNHTNQHKIQYLILITGYHYRLPETHQTRSHRGPGIQRALTHPNFPSHRNRIEILNIANDLCMKY